jgi:protein tyrosine/serine phosphatase
LFFKEQGIELKHLGLFKETLQGTWSFISEEVVKESLQLLLNRDLQPVLVWSSGVQETGVVVGCLRKLQGWNLTSVIQEYRAFCGSKSRYVVEQFIELFDLDLIVLPRPQSKLPNWFTVD